MPHFLVGIPAINQEQYSFLCQQRFHGGKGESESGK